MLVLLSPAKTLDFEKRAPVADFTLPLFAREAGELAAELRTWSVNDIQKRMKISENLASVNFERWQNFSDDPQAGKICLFAYVGDVYRGMQASTFSVDDIFYAHDHVRILSGLYGVLRPLDLIQPYRLEMKIPVSGAWGRDLYDLWKPRVAETLGDELILNCASHEYAKAVDRRALRGRWVDVVFKERVGKKLVIRALFAKLARGMMAAHVVKNRVETLDGVRTFCEAGYRFDEGLSSEDRVVFVR